MDTNKKYMVLRVPLDRVGCEVVAQNVPMEVVQQMMLERPTSLLSNKEGNYLIRYVEQIPTAPSFAGFADVPSPPVPACFSPYAWLGDAKKLSEVGFCASTPRHYAVVRTFDDGPEQVVWSALTLEQAKAVCEDAESNSATCTAEDLVKLTDERGPWHCVFRKEQPAPQEKP
jgi:hypothetical protein